MESDSNSEETIEDIPEGTSARRRTMVNLLPGLRRSPATPQSDEREPGYYLMPGDWNTTVKRDGLSLDEVYDVLDSFDDVYEQAIAGLKQVDPTGVPRSVTG